MRPLRRDSFEWILGSTLIIQIVLQALANVAVVTAMVPPKGVPHPVISYGGTNLLVNVICVGLIVGLSRPRPVPAGPTVEERQTGEECDQQVNLNEHLCPTS